MQFESDHCLAPLTWVRTSVQRISISSTGYSDCSATSCQPNCTSSLQPNETNTSIFRTKRVSWRVEECHYQAAIPAQTGSTGRLVLVSMHSAQCHYVPTFPHSVFWSFPCRRRPWLVDRKATVDGTLTGRLKDSWIDWLEQHSVTHKGGSTLGRDRRFSGWKWLQRKRC